MTTDIEPVEPVEPKLGLLGLADHFAEIDVDFGVEQPPPEAQEVDSEGGPHD